MGLISLLIKIFFFYILYTIIVGLWRAYQTYQAVQKQMQQGQQGVGAHANAGNSSYSQSNKRYDDGNTIEAEFTVLKDND